MKHNTKVILRADLSTFERDRNPSYFDLVEQAFIAQNIMVVSGNPMYNAHGMHLTPVVGVPGQIEEGLDQVYVPTHWLREMTMSEGVGLTNATFGNNPMDPEDMDWDKLEAQAKLIQEELNEVLEAIQNGDRKMLRDGVSDVLVTAMGLGYRASINMEEDMDLVLESNLSKVSKTVEDAHATQGHYTQVVGIKTRLEECPTLAGIVVKVDGEQVGIDGKTYPDGKFLKCRVSFREPAFN